MTKCHCQLTKLSNILSYLCLSSSMEVDDDEERELQLLQICSSTCHPLRAASLEIAAAHSGHLPLDLNLSIGVGSKQQASHEESKGNIRCVQAMKQHTAEQIRLAALEKTYAERVRERTRRELELAEKEFARARLVWERAREEMEKAERMKESATRRIGSACVEITCKFCRQRFQP